ncbi:hypothetical protein LTR86_005281 [Recurvomyces mirabilis]|nr:hypothetical protein LTR86_005281 [Recurvomyces mirabilis]
MARAFSTSSKLAKTLKWKLNGTTEDVDWVKTIVEAVVDVVPELYAKADSAIINGNPHVTGNDPLHASGALGRGSVKNRNRFTSYHAYPDGTITFSDKQLPALKVTAAGIQRLDNPQVAASSSASAYLPPAAQASTTPPGWTLDPQSQQYKFWDGSRWVAWQYSATAQAYIRWDGSKWIRQQ